MIRVILFLFLSYTCSMNATFAGVKSKTVREAAEQILGRFGKELGEEGFESLVQKLTKYAEKYGDDAIDAIRKAGPKGFQLLDDAGENAPAVLSLINRYGNDAIWVASKPKSLAIFVKHGDEAASALIKHPGIAVDSIDQFGKPAIKALNSVNTQNARRIAMMSDDKSLTIAGKSNELLDVIDKYGDRAAEYIWNNKGSLVVVSVAAAFISDPEPFINGTKELASIAISPINDTAKEIGKGIAERTNWTLIVSFLIIVPFVFFLVLAWKPWKSTTSTKS